MSTSRGVAEEDVASDVDDAASAIDASHHTARRRSPASDPTSALVNAFVHVRIARARLAQAVTPGPARCAQHAAISRFWCALATTH